MLGWGLGGSISILFKNITFDKVFAFYTFNIKTIVWLVKQNFDK